MPYFDHHTLVEIVQTFSPNTPSAGVCRGFTKMWIQAVLTSETAENQFYGRLTTLSMYFSRFQGTVQRLKNSIQTLLDTKGPFTAEELDILEVRAFAEAIAIQQAPSALKLDSKFISMNHHSVLNPLTASKALDGREIEMMDLGMLAPTTRELSNYFSQLQTALEQANLNEKATFFLSSDRHTIGLYYEPESKKWYYMDINPYLEQDKRLYGPPPAMPSKQLLAENIFESFLDKKHKSSLFSITYCAINPNPNLVNTLKRVTETATVIDPSRKNSRNCNLLLLAAKVGDNEKLQACINAGFKVNEPDPSGMTALMWASKHGHTACVKTLLEVHAKTNMRNLEGASAAALAAKNGHEEIFKLIESKISGSLKPTILSKQEAILHSLPTDFPTATRIHNSDKKPALNLWPVAFGALSLAATLIFVLGGPIWVSLCFGAAALALVAQKTHTTFIALSSKGHDSNRPPQTEEAFDISAPPTLAKVSSLKKTDHSAQISVQGPLPEKEKPNPSKGKMPSPKQ